MALYSDLFIVAKAQLFSCDSFILRRSHFLPAHTGLPSHMWQCLPLSAFGVTHLLISHTHVVGRSLVVRHILKVYTFFNVHESHRHDGTHPSLLMSWGALWWCCFLTCVSTVPEETWTPNTLVDCSVRFELQTQWWTAQWGVTRSNALTNLATLPIMMPILASLCVSLHNIITWCHNMHQYMEKVCISLGAIILLPVLISCGVIMQYHNMHNSFVITCCQFACHCVASVHGVITCH